MKGWVEIGGQKPSLMPSLGGATGRVGSGAARLDWWVFGLAFPAAW